MKILIISLSVLFFSQALLSQADTAGITGFILPEIKIYQKYKVSGVVYHFEEESNLFFTVNDTLFANQLKYIYNTPIDDITKVGFRDGSNIGLGALYTAGFGFLAGFLWGWIQQQNPLISNDHSFGASLQNGATLGAFFALPAALFFGIIIGYDWERFEEVILPKSDIAKKRKALMDAFSSHGYVYSKSRR